MEPRAAEPTLADVEVAWPQWHAWTGVCRLAYASRKMTSPPAVVRGEDARDLIDQIRGWEGRRAAGLPQPGPASPASRLRALDDAIERNRGRQ